MVDSLLGLYESLMIAGGDLGIGAPPGTVMPGTGGNGGVGVPLEGVQAAQPQGMPPFIWIIWIGVFVGFYFLLIRPQRKREKQRQEMVSAIKTGDNVLTTGGLFGKVVDVGEDCFVVEFGTNKGLRIPVSKNDVVGIREPKLSSSKFE